LVLLENNPENGVIVPLQEVGAPSPSNAAKKVTDKKVIQWMLTLHQIGL